MSDALALSSFNQGILGNAGAPSEIFAFNSSPSLNHQTQTTYDTGVSLARATISQFNYGLLFINIIGYTTLYWCPIPMPIVPSMNTQFFYVCAYGADTGKLSNNFGGANTNEFAAAIKTTTTSFELRGWSSGYYKSGITPMYLNAILFVFS